MRRARVGGGGDKPGAVPFTRCGRRPLDGRCSGARQHPSDAGFHRRGRAARPRGRSAGHRRRTRLGRRPIGERVGRRSARLAGSDSDRTGTFGGWRRGDTAGGRAGTRRRRSAGRSPFHRQPRDVKRGRLHRCRCPARQSDGLAVRAVGDQGRRREAAPDCLRRLRRLAAGVGRHRASPLQRLPDRDADAAARRVQLEDVPRGGPRSRRTAHAADCSQDRSDCADGT